MCGTDLCTEKEYNTYKFIKGPFPIHNTQRNHTEKAIREFYRGIASYACLFVYYGGRLLLAELIRRLPPIHRGETPYLSPPESNSIFFISTCSYSSQPEAAHPCL